MRLHVFGIRHHGPGCARALRTALGQLAPDLVLIEGPPDANDALGLLGPGPAADLVPPVALLVHAADDPQNASFYPFAEFSPEWQALRYGAEQGIPTRFMDLPCAHTLALRKVAAGGGAAPPDPPDTDAAEASADVPDVAEDDSEQPLREDPIGMLAEAAGYADHEQWWDVQVEQRLDATGLFAAILEAMTALRAQHHEQSSAELRREAYMRTVIRAAQKEGFARIAVVCGAWHAPVLASLGPAKADAELLKGLPRVKVTALWIPWTYARLSHRSGYGAGVDSPGWYGHVWTYGDRAPLVWATLAARLLRDQDLDASAANVIETVRLAEALAAIRELPMPGLNELREAIQTVLCGAETARLSLIRTRLEIGETLGQVPEQAGQVPLLRDFEQAVKRLRLKRTPEATPLDLDLRKDNDRERSRLLHRLRILGIDWGRLAMNGRGAGTFKESWVLAWNPAFVVDLIAANLRGSTVSSAAGQALAEHARTADLAMLSQLVEVALLAALPAALDAALVELDARAATASDVQVQMHAVAPLARLVRYGDVRETRAEQVLPVLQALFERIIVGLVSACSQLDDDAAAGMLEALDKAHGACLLLDDPALKPDWLEVLHLLLGAGAVHPRIRGRACRLLLEQHQLAEGELGQQASLALSQSVDPAQAAQWIEGLVAGEGLLLVHEEELLATLDAWMSALGDDVFQAQLPLLRRAFASLAAPERKAVAERIKHHAPGVPLRPRHEPDQDRFEPARVQAVLPVLAHILGATHVDR